MAPARDADDEGDGGPASPGTTDGGTAGNGPADARGGRTRGPTDGPRVASRWWYWVAAVPVYYLVLFVVGAWFALVALVGLGLGLAGGPAGPFFGLGLVAALVAVATALAGLVLLVLFPVALYLDAEAVSGAGLDWRPDGVLYALVGLVGALTTGFTLSAAVAVYYLYRRHRHVGVP